MNLTWKRSGINGGLKRGGAEKQEKDYFNYGILDRLERKELKNRTGAWSRQEMTKAWTKVSKHREKRKELILRMI